MASIAPRKDKNGNVISYQIKVSRGRDKLTGKQLTPYTMTYTPPAGWSDNAIQRELKRVAGQFEADCKAGKVLTKEEQKQALADKIEAERRAAAEERRRPSFKTYAETFLHEKAAEGIAKTTLHLYRCAIAIASDYFNDTKVRDITLKDMREFMAYLQNDCIYEKTGKPYSESTIKCYRSIYHAYFEAAIEDEIIEVNPMQRLKAQKRRRNEETEKKELAFSAEQVNYILECLENEPLQWKALVTFAIDSGCRRGEICALKWSDIDFKTGTVTICRNVVHTDRETHMVKPKNGKNRTILLNDHALAVMKSWKLQQAKEFFKQGVSTEFCFTGNTPAECMNPDRFYYYLQKFGKKYGIEDMRPHKLRHTMASLMITNGADIVTVSEKLGHSDVSITLNTYSHTDENAQKRANEALADVLYKAAQ